MTTELPADWTLSSFFTPGHELHIRAKSLEDDIRELREEKQRFDSLVEDVCHMIPEEYDSDISVEGVIMKWISDIVQENSKLRDTMRDVATNVMTPRQCREPLLEALGDDDE